jgi:hypothetical protein
VWMRGREGHGRRCRWGERDRVLRGRRRYERLVFLSVGATLGGRDGCEKLCGPPNVASERVCGSIDNESGWQHVLGWTEGGREGGKGAASIPLGRDL